MASARPRRIKPALERIARALCEHAGNPPVATMDGKPLWQDYLPEARAVLSAIRTPSEGMCDAGEEVLGGFSVSGMDMPGAWSAMIDAALGGN